MKFFVIFTETLGLVLIAIELGIMLRSDNATFHLLGYLGSACLLFGSVMWAKFYNKKE